MVRRSCPGDTRAKERQAPVRTCVGCRKRASVGELLRVVAEDRHVVVDERRRLPGRGAWLHPEPECLTKAERRRAFPRALRVPGTLDAGAVRRFLQPRAEGTVGGGSSPTRPERRKQVDPS
ncbi:YlxR family protein [Amycolatopsis sp.]|uniref:YlxR family protein n=1 Tax=Amycolatopsis sp. TaxID=37632 RepID=UPI002B652AA0|nr:YlxR family protein [Amycolatopsis sp.]HVV09545.1 YlxR family protein [Amycolatopsis sp.]